MWRAIVSIAAVGLNVIVLGAVALACLGFAMDLSRQAGVPITSSQMFGLGFVAFAGVTAVTSIVAIATGARLRGRTPASAIAAEFT